MNSADLADPVPSLNQTKLGIRPLLGPKIHCRMDLGGDAMDYDTSIPTKLKEVASLRQQHATASRSAKEAMTPRIKLIVSNWYTDELGNQTRFIKAHD